MRYLASLGLESDPWEHQVLYDVLEPHAREYSPGFATGDRDAYLGRLAERVFRRLNVRAGPAAAAAHASVLWDILGPASLRVFPEVPGVLARLRAAGYRLAVVSNWQCGLGHFCTELGLGDAFEHVVSSAEVGSQKPAPEIFREAFRRMGVAPERVLHVGDTPLDDLEGARGAGCRGVLVARGEVPEGAPGPVIRSLEELEGLLI
jgi:putative hydrolase of the HAD superfamily